MTSDWNSVQAEHHTTTWIICRNKNRLTKIENILLASYQGIHPARSDVPFIWKEFYELKNEPDICIFDIEQIESNKLTQFTFKHYRSICIVYSDEYDEKLEYAYALKDAFGFISNNELIKNKLVLHRANREWENRCHAAHIEKQLSLERKNYHDIFHDAPISIWEEDFSELKYYLDSLKDSGITNFRKFFSNNQNEVEKCLQMINIISVNQETLKTHKYTSHESFISSLSNVLTRQSLNCFKEELIAISEGKTTFDCETTHKTSDGEIVDVFIRWCIPSGHEGMMSKAYVFLIDISASKSAERRIETLNQNLQQEVDARTKENAALQKNAIIGDMISGFIHNLRTPLNVMSLQTQILCEKISKFHFRNKTLDALNTHPNIIMKAIDDIDRMLNTLMIKRKNDQVENRTNLDLNEFIRHEIDFLSADIHFKNNIRKELFLQTTLPSILIVPSDLSQIFYNIINNSIDAMWGQDDSFIRISTTSDSESVWIEIEDNGPGVPKGNLEKIFDPFFTSKPSPGDQNTIGPTGTGLGLHSVNQLTKANGGEVFFNSEYGKGARVSIRFVYR